MDMVCATGKGPPWVHVPVRLVGAVLHAAYLPVNGLLGNGKCINGKCLCDAKWMGPAVKNTMPNHERLYVQQSWYM